MQERYLKRKSIISLICVVLLITIFSGITRTQTRATENNLSVLSVYREFMTTDQSVQIERWGEVVHINWNFESIRHAELIDFDNNGVFELALVVDFGAIWDEAVIIAGYRNGQAEIIYTGINDGGGETGDSSASYGIATCTDGITYLSYISFGGALTVEAKFFKLQNFGWVTVLHTFEGENWETGESIWRVNGELVSNVEYARAQTEVLGIYSSRLLHMWGEDTDAITLLAYIDSRLETQQPIEIYDLFSLLEHLAGHWVDARFYYSDIIDENVLNPLQRVFWPQGIAKPDFHSAISYNVSGGTGSPGIPIYPLHLQMLQGGAIELTYDTTKQIYWKNLDGFTFWEYGWNEFNLHMADTHRIHINQSRTFITEITYFVDDVAYTLVRYNPLRDSSRYYAEPTDDGIRLRFFAGQRGVPLQISSISIYRSVLRGEKGNQISHIVNDEHFDFSFFNTDFIVDNDFEYGQTYYYSIWIDSAWWYPEGLHPLTFGGEWQMRVDIDEVLGLSQNDTQPFLGVEQEYSRPPGDYHEVHNYTTIFDNWLLLAFILAIIVIAVLVIMLISSKRRSVVRPIPITTIGKQRQYTAPTHYNSKKQSKKGN